MLKSLLFLIMLFPMISFGQGLAVTLENSREGSSFYSKKFNKRSYKKFKGQLSGNEASKLFKDVFIKQQSTQVCAYSLNENLLTELKKRSVEKNYKNFIYLLRENNQIDDVVVRLLLEAKKVQETNPIEKDEEEIANLFDTEETEKLLKIVVSFEKRFLKNTCFDEAYQRYINELNRLKKNIEPYIIEALHYHAYQTGQINYSIYKLLEQGRLNSLEASSLTLQSYWDKLRSLRTQYPLDRGTEKSDFVSKKVQKFHMSRRQKLYESYSDIQIILMANVIKKLRARLEYDAVAISGYRNGEIQETILLEPMERFRFAIKALRKEMSLLSLNTFFNGRSPDYIDLMVASYEIGIIPASELETVASLEEIWNPKKTFWDKAGIWIRTFSSVATIVIPPPYGFIPALVLVVIEGTVVKKKNQNSDDPTSMF